MRRHLAIGLASVLAVATLGATAGCGGDDDTAAPADRVALPDGDDPVDAEFVGFDDEPVTLADYRGRPLVVNLFASWCAPCVSEMPLFERVSQDTAGEVAFLGVAVNDRVEDAEALVERTGVTFDVARDPRGDVTSALGAVGMPTTFLFDADGRLVDQRTGALEEPELRGLLREHFGVGA